MEQIAATVRSLEKKFDQLTRVASNGWRGINTIGRVLQNVDLSTFWKGVLTTKCSCVALESFAGERHVFTPCSTENAILIDCQVRHNRRGIVTS